MFKIPKKGHQSQPLAVVVVVVVVVVPMKNLSTLPRSEAIVWEEVMSVRCHEKRLELQREAQDALADAGCGYEGCSTVPFPIAMWLCLQNQGVCVYIYRYIHIYVYLYLFIYIYIDMYNYESFHGDTSKWMVYNGQCIQG